MCTGGAAVNSALLMFPVESEATQNWVRKKKNEVAPCCGENCWTAVVIFFFFFFLGSKHIICFLRVKVLNFISSITF